METKKFILSVTMFLILLALPVTLTRDSRRYLIVWNIGQGQWTTLLEANECWHFDVGGEFAPWNTIREVCGAKLNRVFLSHWDSDHIGLASQLGRKFPTCLQSPPPGPTSVKKRRRLERLPRCGAIHDQPWTWQPESARNSNGWSQIFAKDGALFPGDSSKAEEKSWTRKLADAGAIHILVLGHHGSRTSTSPQLLQSLPALQMAVASARWKRYGHPHMETIELLRKFRVPLLRTEDWGSLGFEM